MKLLVFGGNGLVGSHFVEINASDFEIESPRAEELDILERLEIEKKVESFDPDAIINFAAYTNVEEAENQKGDKNGICFKVNVLGAKNVADVCKQYKRYLIHISTEYVFDGEKENFPYTEEDKPNPINWYGQTKYLGEKEVLESDCKCAIVRISMPYSARYEAKLDIARYFLKQLRSGSKIWAVDDQRITPTLVDDIANALRVILQEKSTGFYHVSSKDSVTPLEFAKTIAETFGLDYSLISKVTLSEYNKSKKAKLLKYSWLNPTKFEKQFGDDILHTVEESLIIFKKVDEAVKV